MSPTTCIIHGEAYISTDDHYVKSMNSASKSPSSLPQHSQVQCPLFSLPAEIQLLIYSHLYSPFQTINLRYDEYDATIASLRSAILPFWCCCRVVYHAQRNFFSDHVLWRCDLVIDLYDRPPTSRLPFLRHLELLWTSFRDSHRALAQIDDHLVRPLLEARVVLRSLKLSMYVEWRAQAEKVLTSLSAIKVSGLVEVVCTDVSGWHYGLLPHQGGRPRELPLLEGMEDATARFVEKVRLDLEGVDAHTVPLSYHG